MDDFEQDSRQGRVYLGGYLTFDKRGIPRHRYYPERSDDSNYCRAALARVLRSDRPVDRQLRDMLADLFEPIEPLKSPWGSRKLTAGFRNPVKPRDTHANTLWRGSFGSVQMGPGPRALSWKPLKPSKCRENGCTTSGGSTNLCLKRLRLQRAAWTKDRPGVLKSRLRGSYGLFDTC
jgi:hypothetical protein